MTNYAGVVDRILETWDPHGILQEFFTALDLPKEDPPADDKFFTAAEQFTLYKRLLYTPELRYVDLLRLAELWYMDTPIPTVFFRLYLCRAFSCFPIRTLHRTSHDASSHRCAHNVITTV